MDILVKETPKLPHATNKVLLRPHQMVQHEEDIRQCEADLANAGVKMKGIVRQRKKALEKQYLEQAPQPITDGALRDKMAKRINALEEQIKVGLPTAEEMRKATNITVEQHRKWERLNKPKIKEWRNLLRQLNTDTSDPDTHDRSLGDIERLRPMSAQDRLRTDGFITGKMSYGSVSRRRTGTPSLRNLRIPPSSRLGGLRLSPNHRPLPQGPSVPSHLNRGQPQPPIWPKREPPAS
jgi:hypothetical protein